MNKVYIQNLCMIVTNKCNLDCGHCLRGCKNGNNMTKDVIEATLNQTIGIENLCICGGEPTLALDVLEYIFSYIIDNKIFLEGVSITINGTNYSLEFLRLLNYINEYIMHFNKDNIAMFAISYDDYHEQELKRLRMMKTYIENIERYSESIHFHGLRNLDPHLKLFREGNAENLDKHLTVNLRPIDIAVTYTSKNNICCIGPLITINTEGIITEDNSSLIHQKNLYNYGNILTDSLEEVALTRGKILKPKKWYKETDKIIKKYVSYNK